MNSKKLAVISAITLAVVFGLMIYGGRKASAANTIVVKPTAMNGWYFWNDKDDTFTGSPGALVSGPTIPPAGVGSVRLGPLTDNGATAAGHSVIATDAYFGVPLANFTSMSYWTYQTGPVQAIAVQFDVRYRPSDVAYGGRLVFEPYQNGTVVVGSGWQNWSPLSGKWWASKTTAAGSNGVCLQSSPCTWSQINTLFPNAVVAGRFLLKAGSNWNGFDGNADNLTVGVSGNDTTYDFEPTVQCTADCYVATSGSDLNGGTGPGDEKLTIQAAISTVNVGGTVHVAAGSYNEDVLVNKNNVVVTGAGPLSTTVIGPIGGSGSTFALAANNVELRGFKITRAGDNTADWNNPSLNIPGVSIQGTSITGANIHDNLITGMRTGIDINNSSGHSIHNNVITDNRTGMILRNQTDNLTVVENEITNNWTVGIVFLDASGGTNSPVQTALNCTFSNNNISGNWYGQVVDRQTGGSLPAPGANPKNFVGNWWGTTSPVVTLANSTEPGYSAQIPVEFGGTATPPGGQPDIAGPASTNISYLPLLCVGTDTDIETTPGRGVYGFQGVGPCVDQDPLSVISTSPLSYGATETLSTSGGSGSGAVTFSLVSGSCTLLGDQLTANSGVGTCVVNATKAGDDTHHPITSGNNTVNLIKANATCVVNGYVGFYDGSAHGATGTCFGVLSEDLTGDLNLGSSFTNVPGGTANWSFNGGVNYNNQSDSVAIVINKATPTISITNIPTGALLSDGGFFAALAYSGDGTTSITSGTPTVCSVSGLSVSFLNVGLCTLTAQATAGPNYTAIVGGPQPFVIGGARTIKQKVLLSLADISGNKKTDKAVADAIKLITNSLQDLVDKRFWLDDNRIDGKQADKIFELERDAVRKLMDIKNEPPAVDQAILDLLAADRMVAQTAIIDNTPGGDPKKLADANKEMAKAQDEINKGHFDAAVDHFRNAWKAAQKA